MALKCDRRRLPVFGCTCKIWFTLGLFANYLSLKSLSLSLKSHIRLTELWNTSLLFDLNHKFINGSLAFSPG